MRCPHCGGRVDGPYERWLRFFANEIRIATEPSRAPNPAFYFAYFMEFDGMIRAIYKLGIPKVEDPNNRGYKLFYKLGEQQVEINATDGQELAFPAVSAPFAGQLFPIGPDGNARMDLGSEVVTFMVAAYSPPPPPDGGNGDQPLKAPTPVVEFQRFADDDGNTVV